MFSPSVDFFSLGLLNDVVRQSLGGGWGFHSSMATTVKITRLTGLSNGL